MKIFGTMQRFALGFELRPDPDAAGSLHVRASWGAFQIWVGGRNLTMGTTAAGQAVDAAEIPLSPILEWLTKAWDPMFHEERLPRRTRSPSAARWRLDCLSPLPDSDAELDALLDAREAWWQRHSLGSALPDYRIPDLHIRRAGEDVEISWDDREWRSVPGGVYLTENPGVAVIPADEVAQVFHMWALSIADDMVEAGVAAEYADELKDGLLELAEPPSVFGRLECAAGQELATAAQQLRRLAGITTGTLEDTMRSLLGMHTDQSPGGLVTKMTVPVMLYRSAAPNLTPSDVTTLLRLSQDLSSASPALREFQSPRRPPRTPEETTQDGYAKALEFRRAAGIPEDAALLAHHDLETEILPRLGISIKDVTLEDTGVDGVAIAAPGCAPVIAVNKSGKFSSTRSGRRMTLAHELCHLLFDTTDDGRLGIVSNTWAPYFLERRANAFAAMLLIPPAALSRFLSAHPDQWTGETLLRAIHGLGVGRSTLTWHLYNLSWITASERRAWLDSL